MAVIHEGFLHGGSQVVHRFENGWGASVVCHAYSYGGPEGLFELGVFHFWGESQRKAHLDYSTPVTDDVEGHLTDADVKRLLGKIEALPSLSPDDCDDCTSRNEPRSIDYPIDCPNLES